MAILIIESEAYRNFYPVGHNRFIWEITCGQYTSEERFRRMYPKVYVHSPRFDQSPYSHLKELYPVPDDSDLAEINMIINSQFLPSEDWNPQMRQIGFTPEGDFVFLRDPQIRQNTLQAVLNGDIDSIRADYETVEVKGGIFLRDITDVVKMNPKALMNDSGLMRNSSEFISPQSDIYIAKDANVQQYVSLQANNGPVVIDRGATIRSFSLIDGPAYIGKNTVIDSAKVREGTTIRDVCKIGGEIEESVMESYSNKHHEGFVGHSYIGHWVNIGAIATTSDLKNNYGNIWIQIGKETTDTGTNKFGSIICDYSKIGIGMMLNTGTVIGTGTNLFQEYKPLPKYIPSFSWGLDAKYRIERFISDLKIVMSRRKHEMSPARERFLNELYQFIMEDRDGY